ncbi:hypothetical protein IMG5_173700 [Ichthyophthirius multifiliis]|uniref:Uncharacterized protein n=1 Tax=Ichthyophthirius multifiliis TaxID=5932 RepID=G0R1Y9_ICHMU|nr:hypothetical protein IMG5_173700 [Ichthyophthirius multifiliis]EGR28514.1 hypothetical protein IMG5_173700 [Ichthyophthirius multifiliis]|eukprot:XP_004029750.1 hypothetical protein IMG5_173700 [Ichthyophthirius multifiliis]
MQQDNQSQLASTFIILQSIIGTCSNVDLLAPFFTNIMAPFCQVGTKQLTEISNSIQAFNNQQSSQEQLLQSINTLTVLLQWSNLLHELIHKIMDAKKHDMIKQIIQNDILANMICHGICLSLNTPEQIKDCLISTSSMLAFDDNMNEFKTTLVKTFSRVIKQILGERSKYGELIAKSQFLILSNQILPIIIKGLIIFCQQTRQIDQTLENINTSSLIIECLKLCSHCCEQSEFYQLFQESARILLLEVIFPLMCTSQAEQDTFLTNPEEFVRFSLDTCDRQLSYTYKCASAKLLETICDYIDGFETIVSLLLLQIMSASISCENLESMDSQFPSLSIFKSTVFLSKCPREKRIETCLIGLSVLSYLTPKRLDIVAQIELLIKNQINFFFNKDLNPIIKARVCLMLGYYADTIFQADTDSQYYLQMLNFLITCLSQQGEENRAIVFQAIDSLQNIYDDDGQANKVKQNIKEVFSTILPLIKICQFNQFLEIIFHIVKHHSDLLTQQNIIQCVRELTERVLIETQAYENKKNKDYLFINKSWNIIRHMSENPKIIPQYIDSMLHELKPLLQYVQYPEKIDFDEDIVLLVGSFIKHQKSVHPICGELANFFPKIFEKQQRVFGQLFFTLNNLIVYGKDYLLQNINTLQVVVEMCFKALFSQSNKSNDADKAEGATLLQILMQNLGDRLPEQIWKVVFENAVRFFQGTEKFKHFFVYGRTAGIFLSGFVSNVHMCHNVLVNMGIFNQVIDLLVSKLEYYKRGYDIKIFIISMSKVIEQINVENIKIVKILDCLITLLHKQKNEELKTQQKRKNNDGHDECDDFDDQDDEDEDDEDDDEDEFDNDGDDEEDEEYHKDVKKEENNQEYDSSVVIQIFLIFFIYFFFQKKSQDKVMLKDLISSVVHEDEFNFFKSQILIMKQKNQAALQQLVSQLNNEKQEFLKSLLSIQRVKVGDEHVVRVIRKYKRKNQQS